MNRPTLPTSRPAAGAHGDAVDIDHLLGLTNTRLYRLTGSEDVIATRLGLRQLKRVGMKSLVFGLQAEVGPIDGPCSANDEDLVRTS